MVYTLKLDALARELSGKRVLVAVSGGADSVALLRLLSDSRDERAFKLFAAHFEHGIRGEASLEDMEFVKKLCAELKVPLTVGTGDVPREAALKREGLESAARRLRHEFLENTRAALNCDFIALAHHRRDRAETVLMHILRGGGLRGAAAMPMRSDRIIRPLIDTSPEEIRKYLIEAGQGWREDESNSVADNPRNALRLNVFPELKKIYPGFESALCRLSDLVQSENAFIDAAAENYISERCTRFAGIWILPPADKVLMRRVVKRIIGDKDNEFEAVERALAADRLTDILHGWTAAKDGENTLLIPPSSSPAPQNIDLAGKTVLEGVCTLECESCPPVPIKQNGFVQVLKRDALENACLRLRRDGDFIKPLGLNGKSKSLGDYLTDRKYSPILRNRLPVVAKSSEILWVPGVGISESAKLSGDESALRLTINIEK
ncbi:MAG: tRNA lysidine(34) synthetase TilS [Clostridia bacterium]|nr:tRNA lysidine(34) synthetase TilS [Clostridia bacterium]